MIYYWFQIQNNILLRNHKPCDRKDGSFEMLYTFHGYLVQGFKGRKMNFLKFKYELFRLMYGLSIISPKPFKYVIIMLQKQDKSPRTIIVIIVIKPHIYN